MDKVYTPTEIVGTLRRLKASCRKQACVDFSSSFEMRRLLIALGQTADSRAVKGRVHKLLAALHAFEKNLMQHVHKAKLRRTRANLVYQLEALEAAVSLVPPKSLEEVGTVEQELAQTIIRAEPNGTNRANP